MDESGQIPYWAGNPPEDFRPQVITSVKGKKGPLVTDAKIAANLLREYFIDRDQEHYFVMYLNTRNNLIGMEIVAKGTLNSAIVHPREVFKGAIRVSAASVIVGHNHPSGDPAPSKDDDELHRRIENAGDLIGIRVLDSIVLGENDFYSYMEGKESMYR